MGLQVGEEADPGATYFGAVWAGVRGAGRGFDLGLLGGGSRLSQSSVFLLQHGGGGDCIVLHRHRHIFSRKSCWQLCSPRC